MEIFVYSENVIVVSWWLSCVITKTHFRLITRPVTYVDFWWRIITPANTKWYIKDNIHTLTLMVKSKSYPDTPNKTKFYRQTKKRRKYRSSNSMKSLVINHSQLKSFFWRQQTEEEATIHSFYPSSNERYT